jgi:large subunit ribosomal protein L25
MAKKQSLKAAPRARTGSGRLNQMRREGWLPSVIYGRGTENLNLKVDAKAFSEMLAASSSENIVVNLDIEGTGARLAFLQAIHHDPISGKALHADFLAIDENTAITAQVPVHLVGEPIGVKAGGLLELYLHTIEVTCLPGALPDALEFDVTHLAESDSLHISDVTFPAGVVPTQAGEVTIAHIGKQGSGEEAAAAAAEGEAATAAAG